LARAAGVTTVTITRWLRDAVGMVSAGVRMLMHSQLTAADRASVIVVHLADQALGNLNPADPATCRQIADLSIDTLSKGLFVEYLGETANDDLMVGLGGPPPLCDRLWHGHSGVIWEPAPQHVQVTWVGLEDTVQSFGFGHSCDDHGLYSLGVITASGYEERRRRVLAGKAPQR
jgi:hypothetical protein